ncbi:MAG: hypothetical protein L0I62_09230 [Gammaproteobacteria bacterium]|nr:hypothetical protein [Gammaproteobacteria bacterium]
MSRSKKRKPNRQPRSRPAPASRRRRRPAPTKALAADRKEGVPKLPFSQWPERASRRWLLLLAILVATWLVYWGTGGLDGGWLLDDYGNIVNNDGLILHGTPLTAIWWAELWHVMFSFDAGPLGRPLSLAFFALQRYWGGLDPSAFKAVNLVLHLMAVILLYGFTRALLHAWRRRLAPTLAAVRIEWVALGIAAAWALHPMNLTPILYAVQRETTFAALFTLAGLWLYVYLRERFCVTTWKVLILIAVEVLVFTALGAYAKETGVLLPLFTLVLEVFVLRFRDGPEPQQTARKLWWLYLVLLVLPAAIGLYEFLPSIISGSGFVTREFNLTERVLTEGRIVLLYIFLILIPWLPGMALHWDYFTLSEGLLNPPSTLGSFLILAALLLLAWLLRRRKPLVALGIAWFFASQVLESTIFPLELAYEHRVYLGDWGLIVAVAALTLLIIRPDHLVKPLAALRRRIFRPLPARRIMIVLAVAVVVLLGSLTAVRAWHWRDNLALARYEALHHPMSPRGTYLVARIMTNRALSGQTQFIRPAFEAAQIAARVPNAGLDPWVAMILLAAQTDRPVPDVWFDGMIRAVAERPFTVSDVNALQALVQCYTRNQCQLERANLERLFEAIHHSPRFETLGMNYANVLVTEANFIGYTTAAERARSAPLLLKAANVQRGTAQFQINVFNVALADSKFALAKKMLDRVRKLNTLGHWSLKIEDMERRLQRARTAGTTNG